MADFKSILNKPLLVIKSLLDENHSMLEKLNEVGDYIKTIVDKDIDKIPCLNEVQLEQVAPHSLVRYRGMVQDMFDPEFYLAKYDVNNPQTTEKVSKYGCFTDSESEQVDFNASGNVTMERQTFCCVPIPGENDWVKNLYKTKNNANGIVIQNCENNVKRKISDADEEMNEEQDIAIAGNQNGKMEKKIKVGLPSSSEGSSAEKTKEKPKEKPKVDYTRNFPLPTETGSPCFIKMYSKTSEFKLNDVADFVCVLSVDPEFASTTMHVENMEQDEMVTWHQFNAIEDLAHCPPPSLVPRLHCLYFNRLDEINPSVRTKDPQYESASKELTSIRADLIQLLTQVFGGDNLVAEYLLLHLISSVYGRVGTMCVGNFSMNISNCPKGRFTEQLAKLISCIVEKSFYLPMTLDNLNNQRFVPTKDFEANRLISGILQLSEGTNLILDETKMEPGKLDTDGVKNLTALGNLTLWQKLDYDFKYNQVGIETNVNVLVLSEGKSLLKCHCKIPISSDAKPPEDGLDNLVSALAPKLLERIRLYFSIVRSMKYELTEEVQKALEDDFVEMRKKDSKAMNADAFYNLLTTARYMALSHGQSTLSAALWSRVKDLDAKAAERT